MIPVGDVNPTRRRPWLLWLFALANLAVFLLVQLPLEGCEQTHLLYRYAVIPRELTTWQPLTGDELASVLGSCTDGAPTKNVGLSLFTSLFLHGSLGHLLGNLIYLLVFGDNIEDRLGHLRFLLFYAVGGAAATLAYTAVRPDSLVPLVGASGAIAALLGAYLVCFPRARVLAIAPFPVYLVALVLPGIRIVRWLIVAAVLVLPAWVMLGGWFVVQSLATRTPDGAQIAYEAHVGGFLAGIVMLLLIDGWRRRHGRDSFHPPRRR